MRRLAQKVVRAAGFDVVRHKEFRPETVILPPDVSPDEEAIVRKICHYTMTSVERQLSLIQAVRHVVRAGIPGCFVECGVWRGGSSMASALTLIQEGDTERDLFLFDTFEGMPPPTDDDRSIEGSSAAEQLAQDEKKTGIIWARAGLEDVQANMASTNYPAHRLHFIKGPVEETIPSRIPDGPIALLRLDTDWYESTRHEMIHLFPRLQPGGILIIDDYGHWEGARKAIDEYLGGLETRYFLHRIDYTGRLLIKR